MTVILLVLSVSFYISSLFSNYKRLLFMLYIFSFLDNHLFIQFTCQCLKILKYLTIFQLGEKGIGKIYIAGFFISLFAYLYLRVFIDHRLSVISLVFFVLLDAL
jgi:hypothetical protein